MAATVIRGGETANVLPKNAEAVVNVRLLPGDTSESALRRIGAEVRKLGFDEKSFTCSLKTAVSEPSRVSSIESDGFRTLHRTIAEVYPGAVVAPGALDGRDRLAAFRPDRLGHLSLPPSAGHERRPQADPRDGRTDRVKTYAELIGFLARLMRNLALTALASAIIVLDPCPAASAQPPQYEQEALKRCSIYVATLTLTTNGDSFTYLIFRGRL